MPSPSGAIVKGWIYKHKRGAKSGKFQKRYAVYELETGFFNYYSDETQQTPKGRTTVRYAVPKFSIKAGEVACEFTFRSEENRFYDVIVDSTETRDMWIEVRRGRINGHRVSCLAQEGFGAAAASVQCGGGWEGGQGCFPSGGVAFLPVCCADRRSRHHPRTQWPVG